MYLRNYVLQNSYIFILPISVFLESVASILLKSSIASNRLYIILVILTLPYTLQPSSKVNIRKMIVFTVCPLTVNPRAVRNGSNLNTSLIHIKHYR
jgi:hypothetical protein